MKKLSGIHYRKEIFCISFILLFLSLIVFSPSCKNTVSPLQNNQSLSPDSSSIPSTLNVLYLANDSIHSNNELGKLFLPNTKKVEKLIFSFYHTNKDSLTLLAWTSEKGNKNIDSFSIALHRLKPSSVNIAGMDILMGNQETKDKPALDAIRYVINKKGYEFIIFTPKLGSNAGQKYIYYSIDGVDSLQKQSFNAIGSTNPCPPYDGF
ncbi:MAG: hypothetical protein ACJ75B_07840 [Flavisolibacter sp.]